MTAIGRKILFYEVRTIGTSGSDPHSAVDFGKALEQVAHLPAVAPAPNQPSRYMPWTDGDELLIEIVKTSGSKTMGVFAQKQYAGIGRLERRGEYRDLVLEAGEGLAHLRHFVYWADRHLLGIEINGRGPGMTALSRYVVEKAQPSGGVRDIEFVVLLAPDPFDRLQRAERISSATIGVRRGDISAVSAFSSDVHRAFKAADEATNANELRIEFKLGNRKQGASLDLTFLDRAKRALAKPATRSALTALQATVKDPEWGTTRTM